MGVITLSLIAYGSWTSTDSIPFWVKVSCAVAIAAGTWIGGWRVIPDARQGSYRDPPHRQGMAAETASAVIILSSAPQHSPAAHPRRRPSSSTR